MCCLQTDSFYNLYPLVALRFQAIAFRHKVKSLGQNACPCGNALSEVIISNVFIPLPQAIYIKPILLAETPVKMRDTALSWRRLQSFCASTLQPLTMWVTFSTVSTLNLHISGSTSWYMLLPFINNIISSATVFAGVLFVHQSGTNHEPGASVTQVNHFVHTLSTFLRIRANPSLQIF